MTFDCQNDIFKFSALIYLMYGRFRIHIVVPVRNEKDNFFYHGKNIDGSFNPEVTILAAIPLLFNQIEKNYRPLNLM